MLATAQQILLEERDISVFWSGGIDSTAALVALLLQKKPMDRDRMHVFLRPRSIDEYPAFFAARAVNLHRSVSHVSGGSASGISDESE